MIEDEYAWELSYHRVNLIVDLKHEVVMRGFNPYIQATQERGMNLDHDKNFCN